MNNTTRLPSHLRSGSLQNTSAAAQSQNSAIAARIAEKRAELANLQELRALSAQLADQMASLEAKLATLSSGTEAVAAVLGNWGAVLKAVQMASLAIPRPKDEEDQPEEPLQNTEDGVPMPQTLVRIPIQETEAAKATRNES